MIGQEIRNNCVENIYAKAIASFIETLLFIVVGFQINGARLNFDRIAKSSARLSLYSGRNVYRDPFSACEKNCISFELSEAKPNLIPLTSFLYL